MHRLGRSCYRWAGDSGTVATDSRLRLDSAAPAIRFGRKCHLNKIGAEADKLTDDDRMSIEVLFGIGHTHCTRRRWCDSQLAMTCEAGRPGRSMILPLTMPPSPLWNRAAVTIGSGLHSLFKDDQRRRSSQSDNPASGESDEIRSHGNDPQAAGNILLRGLRFVRSAVALDMPEFTDELERTAVASMPRSPRSRLW